jgi:hypothetical protein
MSSLSFNIYYVTHIYVSIHAAEFIGVKSPPPYRPYILRKEGVNDLKFGMNFAYGGTGVFDTFTTDPNMTVQINEFQKLIKKSVFTAKDLNSSAAFFFLSGNDYAFYLSNNKSLSVSMNALLHLEITFTEKY